MSLRAPASRHIANDHERELLRRIWIEADSRLTGFVSIDTEYVGPAICELGIATRRKNGPTRGRHLIVDSNRDAKRRNPKAYSFGPSESVRYQLQLCDTLTEVFARLQRENEVVVLVGHDVLTDIGNLREACGWVVPDGIIVLDTLNIWRAGYHLLNMGNLEQALGTFGICHQACELHNAGNDAWYTMELLFCKANWALDPQALPALPLLETMESPAVPLSTNRRKRKRRPSPTDDDSALWSEPEPKLEPELGPLGPVKKERRIIKAVRSGAIPAAASPSAVVVAAAANSPVACPEVIDLTRDTPSPVIIDLTGDTPPRSVRHS